MKDEKLAEPMRPLQVASTPLIPTAEPVVQVAPNVILPAAGPVQQVIPGILPAPLPTAVPALQKPPSETPVAEGGKPVFVTPPPKLPREVELMNELDDFETVGTVEGTFIKVNNPIFGAALVKDTRVVEKIDPTKSLVQTELRIPKWAYDMCLNLFRAVYFKQRTEVAVLFYYNKRSQDWKVVVPVQEATGTTAKYDVNAGQLLDLETGIDVRNTVTNVMEGWVKAGSAHSHCMMNAFWSGPDDDCELPIDGFHITFGKVMERVPDLACSLVLRRTRFKLPPNEVFNFDDDIQPIPANIFGNVQEAAVVVFGYPKAGGGVVGGPLGHQTYGHPPIRSMLPQARDYLAERESWLESELTPEERMALSRRDEGLRVNAHGQLVDSLGNPYVGGYDESVDPVVLEAMFGDGEDILDSGAPEVGFADPDSDFRDRWGLGGFGH